MNIKSKWSIIAGTVLVSGALLTTGVVFAASGSTADQVAPAAATATQPSAQSQADRLDAAVKSGKITQAEADVLKQLGDLRKSAMDKLKADSQAVIDQAVKDGKITQAEADKLNSHDGHMGGHGGFEHRGGHGWNKGGKHGSKSTGGATQDQSQSTTNPQ